MIDTYNWNEAMIFPNGFNDELSRSPYKDFMACQRPEVFGQFETFISEEKPSLVVEIGTCYGGLSLSLFETTINLSIPFITYDIAMNDSLERLKERFPIDLRIENIFEETTRECYDLKEFKDFFLSFPSPVLILCDGGNKIGEFNAFAKLLRVGDILMAHDFAYDQKTFESDSIWGWKEIEESDISDSMKQYNLYYYRMHIWRKLAWCCVKKLY